MKLVMRSYRTEDDFWRIRDFLRQVFLLNGCHMHSWPVARWDYWRWHGILNLGDGKLEEHVWMWETPDGQIAAVLNREGAGQAFLQIHPAFKNLPLEEEMIALAEERLRASSRTRWLDIVDMVRCKGYPKTRNSRSARVYPYGRSR